MIQPMTYNYSVGNDVFPCMHDKNDLTIADDELLP